MSDPNSDSKVDAGNNKKRSLSSWMSSTKVASKTTAKKQHGESSSMGLHNDKKNQKKPAEHTEEHRDYMNPQKSKAMQFSKLLEGVVFVLSGFVNPDRGTLRSQGLEMGAVYKPDWTSDCTLLVCAFPNTPKFRQVEANCGTIVSKEWISECYNQKKLVEIDQYLMHAGKPWRKNNLHHEVCQAQDDPPQKRTLHIKKDRTAITKDSGNSADVFSPSQVKEWAIYDFKNTISWLESQEEKPEPDEVKKIAAEGIITCLQDAIEALKQDQDVGHAMEQWSFVPHVVKELAKLVDGEKALLTKKELAKLAVHCRQIYAAELENVANSPKNQSDEVQGNVTDDMGFDSDATIEMTEEEIDLACRRV